MWVSIIPTMGSTKTSLKGKKMIRSRNVIPALKDKLVRVPMVLSTPLVVGTASVPFCDPWYDYQVVGMAGVVDVATGTTAVILKIGTGPYTDRHGVLQPINPTKFLDTTVTPYPPGTPPPALAVGTITFFPIQLDPLGQGLNILPAGAPLLITGPSGGTGEITFVMALRPKDKDRNDISKRPKGAADEGYGTYYK